MKDFSNVKNPYAKDFSNVKNPYAKDFSNVTNTDTNSTCATDVRRSEDKMNRILDRKQATLSVIWILIIGMMICLWPLRFVQETVVSQSTQKAVMESEPITTDYVVQQMFVAQYDRLKDIDIYFTQGTPGEEFNFVLYDASMNILMQQVIGTDEKKEIPGFCTVQVNMDVEVGKAYYFLIQGTESPFRVAYENTEDSGNIYNGTLYYGNVEDTDHCMIARYAYEMPLRKGRTLAAYGILLLLGIFATWLTERYYKSRPERNRLVTTEQVCKAVLCPVILVAGGFCALVVFPARLFTIEAVSIVFYEVGILLAVLVALYAVCHDRSGMATSRSALEFLRERWQDYLQSAMIAGALWGCCNYMNGLYEIHHTVAYRQVLIFLALSVIVTYSRREIFTVYNAVYAVIAAVAGCYYYQTALAALEDPEPLEIQTVKLTVWVGVLAGAVLINTVIIAFRGCIRGFSPLYGALIGAFFVLLLVYRNTRGWPIYLVCAFTLFYLRMAAWDKKAHLLQNIGNGVLFHFAVMVIYCLLHRPYMFFQYYRYPFIFHTVTISAVYLAMVVCVAMVKLLDAYRKHPCLSGCYKELFLFGTACVYLLLTLSRTGYLAIIVTAIIVIPATCFCMKKRLRHMFKIAGMMIAAALICFPIIFTAQRIIPSVKADPEPLEIEELPTEIVHGRVMDSYYYITIERFVQVFQMKVLGIPEERCVHAGNWVRNEEKLPTDWFLPVEKMLLASEEDMALQEEAEGEEQESSYANGRMEIFRVYYENLNKTGHQDMGIMQPDGNFIVHAHNIYLQVAYDHGIYVGIVFILVGAGTFLQSALFYHRKKEVISCAALPLAMLLLFGVAGLTEWIFHPCCPIAMILFLTMSPLLFDCRKTV